MTEHFLTGIYAQIFHECNLENIREFLREIKDRSGDAGKEIKLALSKEDSIASLRDACDQKLVPAKEVREFLQNSEENGQQHIFLWTPKDPSKMAMLHSASEVAERLFGESWGPDYFPRFDLPYQAYSWADFRTGLPGKPNDWIAKLYGHEQYRRSLGDPQTKQIDEDEFEEVRRYKLVEVRTVLLARWNHPDLLEIRIDNRGLHRAETLAERRLVMWQKLERAFSQQDFDPFPLSDAMARIVDEAPQNTEAYRLGRLALRDSSFGEISFSPAQKEMLDVDEGRVATLKAARHAQIPPRSIRIHWQQNEEAPESLPQDLLTILTSTDSESAIAFRKRITPEALNYVISRLRHYSSGAT